MNEYRVLVIGPRRGLLAALRERRIPYAVWQATATPRRRGAERQLVAPLWKSPERIRRTLRAGFSGTRYTHVIAGTEAGIYPAALARRLLGARHAAITTTLRCRDKLAMKRYLYAFGIPMTRFLAESAVKDPASVFAALGTPVVRKSRKSSGGRTLQLVQCADDLALQRGSRNILESYIDAPEASIESFINGGRIRFTNITAYHEKGHVNFVPAAFDAALDDAIRELNRRVIEALQIRWGLTHLEVYLTRQGLLFGEIALRPPGGYIMNALHHAWGFDPWAAFLAMELDEPFAFPDRPRAYTAVQIFHPGAGTVTAIRGAARLRDHPATREFHLKVRPGERIAARSGSGQDIGYLLLAADTATARRQLHDELQRRFRIELA